MTDPVIGQLHCWSNTDIFCRELRQRPLKKLPSSHCLGFEKKCINFKAIPMIDIMQIQCIHCTFISSPCQFFFKCSFLARMIRLRFITQSCLNDCVDHQTQKILSLFDIHLINIACDSLLTLCLSCFHSIVYNWARLVVVPERMAIHLNDQKTINVVVLSRQVIYASTRMLRAVSNGCVVKIFAPIFSMVFRDWSKWANPQSSKSYMLKIKLIYPRFISFFKTFANQSPRCSCNC